MLTVCRVFRADSDFMEIVLDVLLSLNYAGSRPYVYDSILAAVVPLFKLYQESMEIVRRVCNLVASLLHRASPSCISPKSWILLTQPHGLGRTLFRLIRRANISATAILPAACGALAALTELTRKEAQKPEGGEDVPRAVAIIRDDDIRCVLDTMKNHTSNLGVLLSAARVLYNLLAYEATCAKFANAGVEAVLTEVMAAHPAELELHKMCVTALGVVLGARSITKGRHSSNNHSSKSSALPVVLASLRTFAEDAEQILRTLRVLAHSQGQAEDMLQVTEICNQVLQLYKDSPVHIIAVCNVILNFVPGADPAEVDCKEVMSEVMIRLATSLRSTTPLGIREAHPALSRCLALCTGIWQAPAEVLVPAVLGQLEQESSQQNAELLISVCNALKNLAMKDPAALEEITARNGFDIIFNGTQAHKENVELLKTALDVLSLLRAAPQKGDVENKAEADKADVEAAEGKASSRSKASSRCSSTRSRQTVKPVSAASSSSDQAQDAEWEVLPLEPVQRAAAAKASHDEALVALPVSLDQARCDRDQGEDGLAEEEHGGSASEEEDQIRDALLESARQPAPPGLQARRPKAGSGLEIPTDAAMPESVVAAPDHLDTVPAEAEPFARVKGKNLVSQMIMHDLERLANQKGRNEIVYDCFEELAEPPPPGVLSFESRFESGNLRRAVYVGNNEYDLMLKVDINTKGNTQWYYFSINGMQPTTQYKFNIINLLKPDSQYNHGMQPLVYSERHAADHGVGWHRKGEQICYYQNHHSRGKKEGNYFTLTFALTFQYENDVVYLAYGYPYTYTKLMRYLGTLEDDPANATRLRRKVLCRTLAGNNCEIVTITSFDSDPEEIKKRRGIFLSARVHPGESNASWVMQGVLDYLLGQTHTAKVLRDNFIFKIVPMLNPDGVVYGNCRCSLAGVDLNRRWQRPSKTLHPTIYFTKQSIKKFQASRQILLFCDMHGHSRKKNVFMYGCEARSQEYRLYERILPRLLWENALVFSYEDCSFCVQKSKEGTGRVVVARELNITNSYTLEASFCGANFGRYNACHFSTMHFEQVGRSFCETIFDFCDPNQTRARAALQELQMLYPANQQDEVDQDSDFEDDRVKGKKKKPKDKDKERDKSQKKTKPVSKKLAPAAAKSSSSIFGEVRVSRGKDEPADVPRRKTVPTSSREKTDRRDGGRAVAGPVRSTTGGGRNKIKVVVPMPRH